ncbi:uncharacterized protein PHALS_01101 [Plasmopara halstedii]|uniref:Uncharacterized protein n=1 Tax=Plasmopara halstedii TaxID=4781 RepID=A0A0N7L6N4_PLAHL|nr:uncharacterized protein PHALS_01101 [Plasmopara halstedii]CEG44763.1 hypothetical protein PHALS_01101 [Plasmopara halstedii]|eukprot:XP_024581132.1 hypothetical protein PHALS_01101 [Plasmopara halstedii]
MENVKATNDALVDIDQTLTSVFVTTAADQLSILVQFSYLEGPRVDSARIDNIYVQLTALGKSSTNCIQCPTQISSHIDRLHGKR